MSTFSDFNNSFATHPSKKDLALKSDVTAVVQSIKSLLLTDKGERLFQPDVGSNIRQMLFENYTPQTTILLKQFINETIDNFEPRASVIDVTVTPDDDNNTMNIKMMVRIVNQGDPVTMDLILERIR
ncbi:GPW/gp25 family protein [bacterium]|nr:GPW/gp25 family protein [bacterium]